MDVIERIRLLVSVGDPDGTVSLRWLASLLGEDAGTAEIPQLAEPRADPCTAEIAERFKRSEDTVLRWIRTAELEGAYIDGNTYRVPEASIAQMVERRRAKAAIQKPRRARPANGISVEETDLAGWRTHLKKAG